MRIGIDIRALQENKTTGVQVYILNLLHAILKLDRDNQYLLFANSYTPLPSSLSPGGRGEGEGGFDYPNVKLCHFQYPNKLFNLAQKILGYPKIDKLLSGLDLFFSPHWRVTALDKKIPLVITIHDLSFEVMSEFFTLRQRLWHKFMNLESATRLADKLIAVSESTKKDLVALYGVPESKITVIYPGVPQSGNLPPSLKLRRTRKVSVTASSDVTEDFSPPFKEDYFLYLGTFEPRKNIAAVLAAYEKYYQSSYQKRTLILAGSSGWKTRIKIPPHLKSRILIRQNVSEQAKAELYQNAFALLFLSFYEGFGFPILEAASCGLPVISSFATSLAEIGSDFALLVNPMRPSQIASAMLELENDSRVYQELKNKGMNVAKRFSWEKTARETLGLFRRLI